MSLNYIGMIQYIGHGTKKHRSHGLLLFPFLKPVITPNMDLLTFWKTFWKTFPSAKVVVPIPQNPQKWMMWGKGKLMNSGRREWKVNIAARLHAETYHTQSIAKRGTFGNILCVICGKHATWTRIFYLVVNSVLANIVLLWHSIWNGSTTQVTHNIVYRHFK